VAILFQNILKNIPKNTHSKVSCSWKKNIDLIFLSYSMQTQSTPRLFFYSLCLRVYSLSGSQSNAFDSSNQNALLLSNLLSSKKISSLTKLDSLDDSHINYHQKVAFFSSLVLGFPYSTHSF
jgi:hypothetical protein